VSSTWGKDELDLIAPLLTSKAAFHASLYTPIRRDHTMITFPSGDHPDFLTGLEKLEF